MLINLKTSHKPRTLHEAAELLKHPDTYPVYGGGAALIRQNSKTVHETVDLSALVPARCVVNDNELQLGACATLEAVVAADAALGEMIKADAPLTLRNALTVGDVLLEARPDSLFLAALFGLTARVDTPARGVNDLIEVGRWFEMTPDERRQHILLGVVVPRYPETLWCFASAKVSRTPADAPIVAAVGFAYAGEPDPGSYAVVCGLDNRPRRYADGMSSAINDYKGSAEYRAEMAREMSHQAIARATELAASK